MVLVTVLASASCSPAAATRDSVSVGGSRLGAILVDRDGHALYLFRGDKADASVCVGVCARVWPPAPAQGKLTAGGTASPASLGTIRRADRTLQLTFEGHPLYTFSGDAGPGQINGEGFLGSWFVISPRGQPITDPSASAPVKGY